MPCSNDKIYNPQTKRCVSLSGDVGKALIKKHAKGELALLPENVAKVASSTLAPLLAPKEPQGKATKEPKAAPAKEAKENPVNPPSYSKCPPGKIYNKNSGKCVLISGEIGKALITFHAEGNPALSDENVAKVKASKLGHLLNEKQVPPDVPKVVPTTVVPQSPVPKPHSAKEAPKEAYAKEAPKENHVNPYSFEGKIVNPLTGYYVLISGEAGKDLIKKHANGDISLSDANVAKVESSKEWLLLNKKEAAVKPVPISAPMQLPPIAKSSLKLKTPPPPPQQPVPEKQLSSAMKKRIHNFVTKWKAEKESVYISPGHQKYCKSGKLADLDMPVITSSVSVRIPISKLNKGNIATMFSPKQLDEKKQKFVSHQIEGAKFTFNNYTAKNLLYKKFTSSLAYFEGLVDVSWVNKMNQYIANLSVKDVYTLVAYTFYGDTLANNYLRKTLNPKAMMIDISSSMRWVSSYFPLFFPALSILSETTDLTTVLIHKVQDVTFTLPKTLIDGGIWKNAGFTKGQITMSKILEIIKEGKTSYSDLYSLLFYISNNLDAGFWLKAVEMYVQDLERVIRNSPPIEKQMIVYRGVRSDYYLKGKQGNVYKTNAFVSTSLNLGSALRFINGAPCCLKRITLLPGTRVILMAGLSKFPEEIEILLGHESQFYITKAKRFIPTDTTAMCPAKSKFGITTVTDVVVIK